MTAPDLDALERHIRERPLAPLGSVAHDLIAELRAARQDAARYRQVLRDSGACAPVAEYYCDGRYAARDDEIDAGIDAAIAKGAQT